MKLLFSFISNFINLACFFKNQAEILYILLIERIQGLSWLPLLGKLKTKTQNRCCIGCWKLRKQQPVLRHRTFFQTLIQLLFYLLTDRETRASA